MIKCKKIRLFIKKWSKSHKNSNKSNNTLYTQAWSNLPNQWYYLSTRKYISNVGKAMLIIVIIFKSFMQANYQEGKTVLKRYWWICLSPFSCSMYDILGHHNLFPSSLLIRLETMRLTAISKKHFHFYLFSIMHNSKH